jgi:hypothetical protein
MIKAKDNAKSPKHIIKGTSRSPFPITGLDKRSRFPAAIIFPPHQENPDVGSNYLFPFEIGFKKKKENPS